MRDKSDKKKAVELLTSTSSSDLRVWSAMNWTLCNAFKNSEQKWIFLITSRWSKSGTFCGDVVLHSSSNWWRTLGSERSLLMTKCTVGPAADEFVVWNRFAPWILHAGVIPFISSGIRWWTLLSVGEEWPELAFEETSLTVWAPKSLSSVPLGISFWLVDDRFRYWISFSSSASFISVFCVVTKYGALAWWWARCSYDEVSRNLGFISATVLTYGGRDIMRRRGSTWTKTLLTHGAIRCVDDDRKWTLSTITVTKMDRVTSIIVNRRYFPKKSTLVIDIVISSQSEKMNELPSKGTTRDVGGMISARSKKNTVKERRMETDRATCRNGE